MLFSKGKLTDKNMQTSGWFPTRSGLRAEGEALWQNGIAIEDTNRRPV